ncbi:MAG: hypothetical protein N3G21_11825 [Candidatus Hydrogenedentes bacterium]|nr:hypothetical protein [Candidatus Hydrogenedentota bacterium]
MSVLPIVIVSFVVLKVFVGLPDGDIACLSGEDVDTFRVTIIHLGEGKEEKIEEGTHHGNPVWSPDGSKIAFSLKMGSGGLQIGVYDVVSKSLQVLNSSYSWNDEPTWSPDGKYLAYISCEKGLVDQKLMVHNFEDGKEENWGGEKLPSVMKPMWFPRLDVLNAMSATVTQVTYAEGFNLEKFFEEGYSLGVLVGVAVIRTASSKLSTELVLISRTQTTTLPKELMAESLRFEEYAPQVSPKGSSMAFESNEGGDREIYYLGRRGISNITNHTSADWNPVWAPNGEWLAFESFRSGRRGIYRVYPETARVFPMVVSADFDAWSPTWAPDSKWICFVSNKAGKPQLYIKSIGSGNEIIQITEGAKHLSPQWRPKIK